MAHSDALIFLTNITWVFLLFLFVYFFFVLFFLPTLYKKFRMRTLIKTVNSLGGVLALRNVLVSLTFFVDFFRGLSLVVGNFINSTLFFFSVKVYFIRGWSLTDKVGSANNISAVFGELRNTSVWGEFFSDKTPRYFNIKKN